MYGRRRTIPKLKLSERMQSNFWGWGRKNGANLRKWPLSWNFPECNVTRGVRGRGASWISIFKGGARREKRMKKFRAPYLWAAGLGKISGPPSIWGVHRTWILGRYRLGNLWKISNFPTIAVLLTHRLRNLEKIQALLQYISWGT